MDCDVCEELSEKMCGSERIFGVRDCSVCEKEYARG